ncbi:ABC transporter ATP-binding protein [Oryzicola mucosus]|uniref:sn-glycerol-3-phosphate ABC transporter ATP-binding protein UgpC n=1 Tax=Oryzicola mucosus TaxID=2767425 RepID=A0A8J6PRC5_9HYPH|nr:sn-glycerol-3-phosphate ABC transporter ATP-binding protein UgpC [Oryzicola mucosus]MBD0416790.1 sn-glycerol-3-phosphate ABC transporter ATP-binding protein UgpC [Oryzicola mucosus]
MTSVSIENVVKKYGHTTVLHDINIRIPQGDFVVLVGPSGCGKSTLLRTIAGLEPISNGTIRIGERVVNGLSPKARNIAMVFQNYALYPHMTVAENMGFGLRLSRVPRPEIAQKVASAADTLGLSQLLDRYPKALSGGQRQRVAMGRALVREPDVFLFDEPLSNLDAKLRVQMRTEIRSLQQRLKTTTIYVTHDQVEAMTMADQIVVMKEGRVEQVGTPLELYDKPESLFVAGFIGSPSMNFLKGTIDSQGFQLADNQQNRLRLLGDPEPSLIERSLIYGIRPEHLVVGDEGIPCRIEVVEPTGAETMLFCLHGQQPITVFLHERRFFRPGDEIHVQARPGLMHLFDPETERRISTKNPTL